MSVDEMAYAPEGNIMVNQCFLQSSSNNLNWNANNPKGSLGIHRNVIETISFKCKAHLEGENDADLTQRMVRNVIYSKS
jgi:hypothetical protein